MDDSFDVNFILEKTKDKSVSFIMGNLHIGVERHLTSETDLVNICTTTPHKVDLRELSHL